MDVGIRFSVLMALWAVRFDTVGMCTVVPLILAILFVRSPCKVTQSVIVIIAV